jgi:hypothetical protein
MMKTVFLTIALLVPGLAYGGNPSANLSVQVIPAGNASTCDAIMGQAATDAATAGFNTCALYNDFTTAIPNSVGTGLPSNWLDCNLDGSTSAVWYWGFRLFENSSNALPCTGHVDWNVVDPTYGNYALRFTLTDSDISAYSFPASGMETTNMNGSNPVPGPGQYPYAYYEWTVRYDNTAPGGFDNAFWSWITPVAETLAGQSSYLLELDFTESYGWVGSPATDAGINQWGPSGRIDYRLLSTNAGLPLTAYHTWGSLFTGDGGNNFSVCSYVDGVRKACVPWSYSANGENLQRRYLMAWLACGATCNSFGTAHQYIKSIKVLTCASWTQVGSPGMCNGSALNGSGFYQ